MNMPKSRDMHAKIPSPKAILLNFGFVSVKVLNRYEIYNIGGIGENRLKELYTKLEQDGRRDEIFQSLSNPKILKNLYKEYGME